MHFCPCHFDRQTQLIKALVSKINALIKLSCCFLLILRRPELYPRPNLEHYCTFIILCSGVINCFHLYCFYPSSRFFFRSASLGRRTCNQSNTWHVWLQKYTVNFKIYIYPLWFGPGAVNFKKSRRQCASSLNQRGEFDVPRKLEHHFRNFF